MKMAAFWDIAPCSVVEIDRRFRGVSIMRAYNIKSSDTENT